MARMKGTRRAQKHHLQLPKTVSVLSQKQSTERVQVMLFGSLSLLFYMRSLFHRSAYDNVLVSEESTSLSYLEFISKEAVSETSNHSESFPILRRGRSTRVDTFLTMMEDGIFDALQRKVLKAIQINVIADENQPDRVLEAYTFTVNYNDLKATDREIRGLQLGLPNDAQMICANEEDISAATFLRKSADRFVTSVNAKIFPRDRSITVALRYIDGCDQDYEPPGFEPNHTKDVLFPAGNGWQKQTSSLGNLNGQFHSMSLAVSYLDHESHLLRVPAGQGAHYTECCPQFADQDSLYDRTPAALSKSICAESLGGHIPDDEEAKVRNRDGTRSSPGPSFQSTQLGVSGGKSMASDLPIDLGLHEGEITKNNSTADVQEEDVRVDQAKELGPTDDLLQQTQLDRVQSWRYSQQTSQLEDDVQMQGALTKILSPEHVAQTGVETQPRDLHMEEEQSKNITSVTRPTSEGIDTKDMHEEVEIDNAVRCYCGCIGPSGDTILCVGCRTLQHPQCYGFLGLYDPRLPALHQCYHCLLIDRPKDALMHLKRTAALRQAMHVALLEELFDELKLVERLADIGISPPEAKQLIDQLAMEGYLVRQRHTPRSPTSNHEKLWLAGAGSGKKAREKLLQLFNPLLAVRSNLGNSVNLETQPAPVSVMLELLTTRYPITATVQSRGRLSRETSERSVLRNVTSNSYDNANADTNKTATTQCLRATASSQGIKRRGDAMVMEQDAIEAANESTPIKRLRSVNTVRPALCKTPGEKSYKTSILVMPINANKERTPGREPSAR